MNLQNSFRARENFDGPCGGTNRFGDENCFENSRAVKGLGGSNPSSSAIDIVGVVKLVNMADLNSAGHWALRVRLPPPTPNADVVE